MPPFENRPWRLVAREVILETNAERIHRLSAELNEAIQKQNFEALFFARLLQVGRFATGIVGLNRETRVSIISGLASLIIMGFVVGFVLALCHVASLH